jgi:hypothetical protein
MTATTGAMEEFRAARDFLPEHRGVACHAHPEGR